MTTAITAPTWHIARESDDVFVGPIAVTTTANGQAVSSAAIKFALVPKGTRPVTADWVDPVTNPDVVTGGVGIVVSAVTSYLTLGLWVKVTIGASVEIVEPTSAAWIHRT